jgi:rSAM/selenodomain-associated transferase 1
VADLLLVFLKLPVPGGAKTRLVPHLGPQAAAELYRVLAQEEVRATAPEAGEYERLLCFAPAAERDAIAQWFPGEELWPQPEGDLGTRMALAFAEGFRRGARRVAIVGTDVPAVSRAHVLEALHSLEAHDLTLGPAHDGGYYLLALRRPEPRLFAGIPWSTSLVGRETLARAEGFGLRVALLETLTDVDTIGDVRLEWPRLRGLLRGRPDLRQAVARALGEPADEPTDEG